MILSREDLIQVMRTTTLDGKPAEPELRVSPLGESALQPASIDLRVGKTARAVDTFQEITMSEIPRSERFDLEEQTLYMKRGFPYLVATMETVTIGRSLAGVVYGRSSAARRGVTVTNNAGWVDPGYEGVLTLIVVPQINAILKPGDSIAQLVVHRLETPAHFAYGSLMYKSKYQRSREAMSAQKELRYE